MANMEEAVSGGREKEVKGGGEDITMWDLGVLILEVQLEMLLFQSFQLLEI